MSADNNQPPTKQDLRDLESGIKQDMRTLESGLKQEMREMRDELVEKMRDVQTEVLTAFHGWARPVDIKLRTLPMIDEWLGLLEERIAQLERQRPRPH